MKNEDKEDMESQHKSNSKSSALKKPSKDSNEEMDETKTSSNDGNKGMDATKRSPSHDNKTTKQSDHSYAADNRGTDGKPKGERPSSTPTTGMEGMLGCLPSGNPSEVDKEDTRDGENEGNDSSFAVNNQNQSNPLPPVSRVPTEEFIPGIGHLKSTIPKPVTKKHE